MLKERKNRKIKRLQSIKIIIEADNTKEEFVIKEPSAVILSGFNKEKDEQVKGEVQLMGKTVDVLFAYYLLTKQLIRVFGDKMVVKVLYRLFASKFDESLKEAKFMSKIHQKRQSGKADDKDIN